MSVEVEARIKDLDARLDNAVVELVDENESIYRVFVPGAIRENNTVKASSKNEAIAKVKEVLTLKIKDRAAKLDGREAGPSDGTLEVQNSKHKNGATNAGGAE